MKRTTDATPTRVAYDAGTNRLTIDLGEAASIIARAGEATLHMETGEHGERTAYIAFTLDTEHPLEIEADMDFVVDGTTIGHGRARVRVEATHD